VCVVAGGRVIGAPLRVAVASRAAFEGPLVRPEFRRPGLHSPRGDCTCCSAEAFSERSAPKCHPRRPQAPHVEGAIPRRARRRHAPSGRRRSQHRTPTASTRSASTEPLDQGQLIGTSCSEPVAQSRLLGASASAGRRTSEARARAVCGSTRPRGAERSIRVGRDRTGQIKGVGARRSLHRRVLLRYGVELVVRGQTGQSSATNTPRACTLNVGRPRTALVAPWCTPFTGRRRGPTRTIAPR
jgi:hypothetical protein